MNILYVSQNFPPEVCAPAIRVHEFGRAWARAGHAVDVLTGFPSHPEGVVHPAYRRLWRHGFAKENRDGIEVYRTWLFPAANRGFWGRIANYSSFALSAAAVGPMLAPRRGVVIATSPQLLVGAAGYWLARTRHLPFVFEVRDLWPQSLEAVGVAGRRSPLYRGLDGLARFLYGHADRVVLDGEAKRAALLAAGVPTEKTAVIRNGVTPDFCFEPESAAGRAARERVRKQLGLGRQFLAAYIGTFGMAHGLEMVLQAAHRLRDFPGIVFLLAGEGAERERLLRKSRQLRLGNVLFVGKQRREEISGLLAAADACLVPLRKSEVFKTAIPSKLFEAMAAGKPVVLSVEGEAREILQAAAAGIAVPPEDPAEFAGAILRLQRDREFSRRLGRNGRRAVLSRYSRPRQATAYLELLEQIDRGAKHTAPADSPVAARRKLLPATWPQIPGKRSP